MRDHPRITDRRSFLLGPVIRGERAPAAREASIASVLVQTRPAHLDAVAARLARLPGCEIHGRDPRGKLVVVIDAPDSGVVGATLNSIAATRHVLSAALVFHGVDVGGRATTGEGA